MPILISTRDQEYAQWRTVTMPSTKLSLRMLSVRISNILEPTIKKTKAQRDQYYLALLSKFPESYSKTSNPTAAKIEKKLLDEVSARVFSLLILNREDHESDRSRWRWHAIERRWIEKRRDLECNGIMGGRRGGGGDYLQKCSRIHPGTWHVPIEFEFKIIYTNKIKIFFYYKLLINKLSE